MDIFIYGTIGKEVKASTLVPQINAATDHINVYINSPGGSVYDGIAIFNALERKGPEVSTFIDGLAYSAASWVALAAPKENRFMSKNSQFGIHQAMQQNGGNKVELKSQIETLQRVDKAQIELYKSKTDLTVKEIEAIMEMNTPLSFKETLALGFIAGEPMKLAALFNLDNTNMSLFDDLLKLRKHSSGEEKVEEIESKAEEVVEAAHKEAETPAEALTAPLVTKKEFEELKAVTEPFMDGILEYIKEQPKTEAIEAMIKKAVNEGMVAILGTIKSQGTVPAPEETNFSDREQEVESFEPLTLGNINKAELFKR